MKLLFFIFKFILKKQKLVKSLDKSFSTSKLRFQQGFSQDKSFSTSKLRFQQGFSLLEVLVAVGLFSIMAIFISQIARTSLRQYKKMESFVQGERSVSGIINLISQDLRGANTHFDFDKNIQQLYPAEEEGLISASANVNASANTDVDDFDSFLWNDELSFLGQSQELQFSSFSLSEDQYHGSHYQQNVIRYFLKNCQSLKEEQSSLCLIRSLLDSAGDVKKNYILLRGVQSLNISYYDSESKVWKSEWQSRPSEFVSQLKVSTFAEQQSLKEERGFFPDLVKLDIEWEGQKKSLKASYQFSVSHPLVAPQALQLLKVLYAQKTSKNSNTQEEKKPDTDIEKPKIPTPKPPTGNSNSRSNPPSILPLSPGPSR